MSIEQISDPTIVAALADLKVSDPKTFRLIQSILKFGRETPRRSLNWNSAPAQKKLGVSARVMLSKRYEVVAFAFCLPIEDCKRAGARNRDIPARFRQKLFGKLGDTSGDLCMTATVVGVRQSEQLVPQYWRVLGLYGRQKDPRPFVRDAIVQTFEIGELAIETIDVTEETDLALFFKISEGAIFSTSKSLRKEAMRLFAQGAN